MPEDADVERATAELDRVRWDLMRRDEVTAVDVGLRRRDGQLTDEVAIRIHVRHGSLGETPGLGTPLPGTLGGVPVDVIEAEYGPQSAEQ